MTFTLVPRGRIAAAGEETSDPSLRIAILCHGGGSGSTRAALDLAIALRRRGLPALLFTLGAPRWRIPQSLPHVCITLGGAPRRIEDDWSAAEVLRLADALRSHCRAEGVGLLNFHYAFPFAEACAQLRAAMGHRAPAIVASLHGGDVMRAWRDESAGRRLGRALATADGVCTVSQAYAAKVNVLLAGARTCRVIPNFSAIGTARGVTAPPAGEGGAVVLHISNFRAVKQVHHVAEAFLGLRRQRVCQLWLVGDGPHRLSLQSRLQGVGAAVRFFGFRPDPAPFLAAADVLLLTSAAESFSLAALEAMSAGVPVVAPDVDGLNELVRHGESGLLYRPGRPRHAADMLLRLAVAPHLRRRLSATARHVAERFSEAATATAYEELFRQLRTP